jgi:hypothetical protein
VGKKNDSKRQHWDAFIYIVLWERSKMPIILELNALNFVVNTKGVEEFSPIQERVNQLLKLEEERSKYMNITS